MSGATPLFLAVESIHKEISQVRNHCKALCHYFSLLFMSLLIPVQLLLEWKTDINHKNKQSKTVLDLIRSADLKDLLISMNHMPLVHNVIYSSKMLKSYFATFYDAKLIVVVTHNL